MKYSTSREKLDLMHDELDKELEMAGMPLKGKRKTDREEYLFVSELDDNKKSTLSNISNKPSVYEYDVSENDVKTKKTEISDLERKLKNLEKKLDNISVESEDEDERPHVKQMLEFRPKVDVHHNEDTARFLLGGQEKQRHQTKFTLECPSFPDQEAEEEDSQDYFEVQQAIKKRKAEEKMVRIRKQSEKDTLRQPRASREKREVIIKYEKDTQRKISCETQSQLRPKYQHEKSSRSVKSIDKKSVGKKSLKDSCVSKNSVTKGKSQSKSKRPESISKGRSKNMSRESLQKSVDRYSQAGDQVPRGEQIQIAKDMKRISNLERQLQHYKRLAKKYKEELDDYKVMEIEHRQLKKNFAKSELIRGQQKKIIQSLKSKMNR